VQALRRIAIGLAFSILGGCSSSHAFDVRYLGSIQLGVRQKRELKLWFGGPVARIFMPEFSLPGCIERWVWSAPGRTLNVDFDAQSRVCHVTGNQ